MPTKMPKRAANVRIPKPLSPGEAMFALHCKVHSLFPVREFRFDATRRWRFDFAFIDEMIAVEIEGGIWNNGAHTRGRHFESDCEKYNMAQISGWKVLRYSTGMVEAGTAIHDVLKLL